MDLPNALQTHVRNRAIRERADGLMTMHARSGILRRNLAAARGVTCSLHDEARVSSSKCQYQGSISPMARRQEMPAPSKRRFLAWEPCLSPIQSISGQWAFAQVHSAKYKHRLMLARFERGRCGVEATLSRQGPLGHVQQAPLSERGGMKSGPAFGDSDAHKTPSMTKAFRLARGCKAGRKNPGAGGTGGKRQEQHDAQGLEMGTDAVSDVPAAHHAIEMRHWPCIGVDPGHIIRAPSSKSTPIAAAIPLTSLASKRRAATGSKRCHRSCLTVMSSDSAHRRCRHHHPGGMKFSIRHESG